MKCSVIVPYADVGERIFRLIDSFINQDFDKNEYEVVLVNNGNEKMIYPYADKLSTALNVKFCDCASKGRSCARNYGIENASGELIIFIDGDEAAPNNFISSYYDLYKKSDKNVFMFGLKKQVFEEKSEVYEDSNELLKIGIRSKIAEPSIYGLSDNKNFYFISDNREKMLRLYDGDFNKVKYKMLFIQTSNMAVPMKIIKKIGFFDENFKGWGCEDWEYGYRAMKNNVNIIYNPDVEVAHFYHKAEYGEKRYIEWKKNLEYMLDKYNDEYLDKLKIFESFFDSKKRNLIKNNNPGMNLWMNLFMKIERMEDGREW